MQRTKIIIALVAVAALTLVAFGLASAQIATNQTYTETTPNHSSSQNVGSWVGSETALATATLNRTLANMLRLKRQQMALFPHLHPIKAAITTETTTVMATDPAGQDKHPATFSNLLIFCFSLSFLNKLVLATSLLPSNVV